MIPAQQTVQTGYAISMGQEFLRDIYEKHSSRILEINALPIPTTSEAGNDVRRRA